LSLIDFKLDGFVKSPPALHPKSTSSLRSGRYEKVFVTAAYFYVRPVPCAFNAPGGWSFLLCHPVYYENLICYEFIKLG